MQRFPTISRAKLLGISLAAFSVVFLLTVLLARPLLESAFAQRGPLDLKRSGVAATIEEWWKTGQANFWPVFRPLPAPSEDSLALDRLISWRANPDALSSYEISDLSHFLLQKSQQYQVSPVLVLSLIDVESRYQKSAISERGAVGMMQLMPDTAQQMAKISGVEWNGPSVLHDPKSNIEYGLRYLVYLKQSFIDPEHVLTAYNIGPSALRRKMRSGEELPRKYLDRVMNTELAYKKRARSNGARPGLWVKSWL